MLHSSDIVQGALGFTIRSIGLYSYSMGGSIQLANLKAHSGTERIQSKIDWTVERHALEVSWEHCGCICRANSYNLTAQHLMLSAPRPLATILAGDCRNGSVLLFILSYGQRTVTKLCSKEED